jgi:8-oxo-dGTP diphosphatase
MEDWDVYDENRNKLQKVVTRGKNLAANEFHLVVNVWLKNAKGEFLISQRSTAKTYPLMWETTGGSVLKGETTLDAALRETKEELGINLDRKTGKLIGTTKRYYDRCNDILDVYLFTCNTPLSKVTIQKEELNAAKWATAKEIIELYNTKKFEANAFFKDIVK